MHILTMKIRVSDDILAAYSTADLLLSLSYDGTLTYSTRGPNLTDFTRTSLH